MLHKSVFSVLIFIATFWTKDSNCDGIGNFSTIFESMPTLKVTQEFTPRANPLPKPSTAIWSTYDTPVYLAPKPDTLKLKLPVAKLSQPGKLPENYHILEAAVNRTVARIYADKWVPQALAGPPPTYKKFPNYRASSLNSLQMQRKKENKLLSPQKHEELKSKKSYADRLKKQYWFKLLNHLSAGKGFSGKQVVNVHGSKQSRVNDNEKDFQSKNRFDSTALIFEIESMDTELKQDINETYTLNVTFSAITVQSVNIWGALHALSTLEQLVEWDIHCECPFIEREVHIVDRPLYPYRGVLLDTARNFYTIESILRQLDAMSLSKLNVFHWHIVDSQSWPLELVASYPDMILDAYSPVEVYSQADVRRVVQYGYLRGIRVVPEIDMPAHANSGWRRAHPDIVTCSDSFWNGYLNDWNLHTALQPTPGHLDILHPATLEVVERVYNEISDLFLDDFFHVGLDEIVPNCYNYSEYVSEWFQANVSRTYRDLVQYWVDRTLPIFLKNRPNRKVVMWEDVVLSKTASVHNLSSSSIVIQSWMSGKANIETLISKGYDVIVSSADFFYLDCGAGGFITNDPRYAEQDDPSPGTPSFNYHGPGGSWCAPYKTWQRIYSYDFPELPACDKHGRILGATVNLWSEQSDHMVVDAKLWPRAAALAELLWSGNRDLQTGARRTSEFTQRIFNFRERLVQSLKIHAEVLVPRYCITRPHSCDLTMSVQH